MNILNSSKTSVKEAWLTDHFFFFEMEIVVAKDKKMQYSWIYILRITSGSQ